MTPAINLAKKSGIHFQTHQYKHDPAVASYGEEAAEKLGLNPAHVYKTLVVKLDTGKLAVAVVPVAGQLNLKAMAAACGVRKAAMADQQEAAKNTGYIPGGISPLGQKKALQTVVDKSALELDVMHVSAGRRGLEIELAPDDLITLTRAKSVIIAKQH
ncbi:Cys-tRNA(Pro) deacylase [Endozoicomonas sp. OPT23]|uniref:Cys-tRNA(Pro) deacylase n=1 Tax=Endozoicomonas sp. OPT23 TaxID=2072845 RepID=UPI00129B1F5B|nr:Cys-tRNA(Pro) deacylase [Endozoicomonas sp. OPT23]MRI31993.1 Cys-tRNA(Pro) deacylase [Endozoicomonas sp. OPT23]